ncbi:zinc-binding alcohol dehydrogenase family protein [Amycolatopsis rhabdoformis]|uniref:Zinc-binding alcohol dehydrogenase family protein n=1 Tax=Amycolatopsis rhabdoformis TaxID=1448059 RepID=A0ABZ1ID32_9PSEU|nr:zinc-binding alcohol dehydrogenase family protein [Amycolatopsis rhabdoformis]WSE31817.1 zinc-binding alcohol dehydrogenase family protein [Amycolatopsis rhabdoformis]
MYAAVVRSFDRPPRYEEIAEPEGELVAQVLAAGLHPRVRSGADGSHYAGDGRPPLVPGIDGVGRLPDGRRVYFVAAEGGPGTLAQRAVVDPRRAVELPGDADPVTVAAAMNPAMSSWVALRRRVGLRPGQRVLVLGATGNAGRLAVEIARHLGAAEVVAAGRDPRRLALLPALGATRVVSLTDDELGPAAADVDVVLDYTWGTPTERAMRALVTHRAERAKPLAWVQIGSPAGPDVTLPSAVLRAANLQLMGSGQGSLTAAVIVAELPALLAELGTFTTAARAVPLAEVEHTWTAPADPGERIVFTP